MNTNEPHVGLSGTAKSPAGSGKWWLKTALMLLIIGFSVYILFSLGDYLSGEGAEQISFRELLHTVSYPLLALLLGVILSYVVVECAKYAYLLKVYTGKFRLRTAVKVMFLGKYYDGVTPFASGGQPFQIYYLCKKKDIPKGAAAAIPMARMVGSLSVWCILALVLITFAPRFLAVSSNVVITKTILIVAWVSIIFNLSIPIFFAVASFFPKAFMRVMAWGVFVLKKMHIVKKHYAVTLKYVRLARDYCASMREVLKKWKFLFPLLLLCVVESAITASIPFFVVVAVANVPLSGELYLQIVCLNVISQFSAYLIPTPGNAGAVETTTSFIFITVSGISNIVGWVILVWRFLTFYIYILSGIGINIFEIGRSAYRRRHAAKSH